MPTVSEVVTKWKVRYWLPSAILATLFAIIQLVIEFLPDTTKAWVRGSWAWLFLFAIVIAGFCVVLAWLQEVNIKLHEECRRLEEKDRLRIEAAERRYTRFEDIVDKTEHIEYGHFYYPPLLHYGPTNNDAQGPGLHLLEEIFGAGKLIPQTDRATWDSIVPDLEECRYRILATPIFETRPRAARISFSRPLFFSEVGAYVSRSNPLFSDFIKAKEGGNDDDSGASWADLVNFLKRNMHALKFTVIKGDISDLVIRGHISSGDNSQVAYKERENSSVASLIRGLPRKDPSDIVFVECFQAEECSEVKQAQVINILKGRQLLYPVCFALPQCENVLRAYLNLGLATIDETRPGGVVGLLLEQMRADGLSIDLPRARRFFVPYYGMSSSGGAALDLLRANLAGQQGGGGQ